MFESKQEFVFIEINQGVSQKSGNPYRMIKLANPATFENFTLSYDPAKRVPEFLKGEKVKIQIDLSDFFGRTQVQLINIYPAAQVAK